MYCPVCEKMHIKYPMLLFGKSEPLEFSYIVPFYKNVPSVSLNKYIVNIYFSIIDKTKINTPF